MCTEHVLCGYWWIVPGILCGIMMLACIFSSARGGFGRWRRHRPYRGWCGARWEHRESPLELLAARYARGEIGKEEYEEIRSALTVEGAVPKT